mgnify:FL=1
MALSKSARRTLKALGGAAAVSLSVHFLGLIVGLDLTYFAGWYGANTFRKLSRPSIHDLIPTRPV